uniref:Ubiquitin conjugation factor E4 A n=1 Tax=Culicoides sonorensis TaxID=179676 RepID=A0A336LVS4_CULSO
MTSSSSSKSNLLDEKLNNLIENVFLITIDKVPKKGKQLIFLEEVAAYGGNLLNLELLEQALFERIMLTNPSDFLIPSNIDKDQVDELAVETKVITYLFKTFVKNERSTNESDSINKENCLKIRELILRNVSTAIKQPALYEGQVISSQLLDIFKDMNEDSDIKANFLCLVAKEVMAEDEKEGFEVLKLFTFPALIEAHKSLKMASLGSMEVWIMPFLMAFCSDKTVPKLGEIVLDFTTPPETADGIRYSDSLFGQLLSLSIMPKNHGGPYEFYENMHSINITAFQSLSSTLWNYLNILQEQIHTLFKSFLLIGGQSKEKMLKWIGNCLNANMQRGQIWNAHTMAGIGAFTSAPDSFMVGLAAVLLRLCKPLFKPSLKVMIVDPTYCAVKEEEKEGKGVHMKDVFKETCILPVEENEERLTADKYNFVTECFFMTHKAIDLGYRVCIEKLTRMSRELHQLQAAYQDTAMQGGADVAGNIMQLLSSKTQQFLCLHNLILEPNNDQYLMSFYEATAIWLTQVVSKPIEWYALSKKDKGFAPQTQDTIQNLPSDDTVPKILNSVPEYILENIVGYLTFIHHFDQMQVATSVKVNTEAQHAIFTMILIFMGSSKRVRNPHVRARLAEGLESLLPNENKMGFSSSGTLFTHHPHRLEIVKNLLSVFVGIEMTGHSVQFEQKFNYRRPMYVIMDYVWKIPEQKACFKKLEREAVKNIEAVEPPLFLRFVNLLINDAIFLLDESLNNLQQIRTLQEAQDNGEWNNLPEPERRQNLQNLQQLGMHAKFDNILGRDTIKILKLLTTETKGIFCDSTFVDRIASMLNYFLLHLVGPKKRNLKVKDKKEFEFDPAHTVREICQIYINLQDSDEFCLAVSNDGRSYSPELFEFAEQVLVKIGGGNLITEILEFSEKVRKLAKQKKEDEEALVDPPDEFLDPIMSTLMQDPVILPSSKITVDRTTIARHFLSDQNDPFNRAPLTMDQVKPDVELKRRITEWMQEKREAYKKLKGDSKE